MFRIEIRNQTNIARILLVGSLWFTGSLRQYFSLHRAVFRRNGEENYYRGEKMPKLRPPARTAGTVGPCPTIDQISRMPGTTKHHRPTTITLVVHIVNSYNTKCW